MNESTEVVHNKISAKTVPLSPQTKLPQAVLNACQTLMSKNKKAWLAGGCVRDIVMNRRPRDYDIVTNASLDEVKSLFPNAILVGESFGVIKLPPTLENQNVIAIDIAIFRKEEGYSDARHPDAVEPGDEFTDVARRDFTVNAIYLDTANNTIIDYVSGLKDIASKTLRTVGLPSERFAEDALRIIRATRLAAQLGFKIEKETAGALKRSAPFLAKVSRERIREEIYKMLSCARPVTGLELMAQNGLWEIVFGNRKVTIPADLRQYKPTWTPQPFHWLVGLGITGLLGNCNSEAKLMIERLTENLKLTNAEKKVLSLCFSLYDVADQELKYDPKEWIEMVRQDKSFIDLLKAFVRRARGVSEEEKNRAMMLLEQAVRWGIKADSELTWATSEMLIKEGFKEGKELGKELRKRHWDLFLKSKP